VDAVSSEELILLEVVAPDAEAECGILLVALGDKAVPVLGGFESDVTVEGGEVVVGLAFHVEVHDQVFVVLEEGHEFEHPVVVHLLLSLY